MRFWCMQILTCQGYPQFIFPVSQVHTPHAAYDVMGGTACWGLCTGDTPLFVMDNRSYPSHSDRSNFSVEPDISEYSDADNEDDESNSREETWLTDE